MIRLKPAKIKFLKVAKSYRRLYGGMVGVGVGGGGGKFVPPHCGPQTSVKFSDFEELFLH